MAPKSPPGVPERRHALRRGASQWAREAYVCGLVMLWDESFYDPASGTFLVEEYLDNAEREFGGFDVLILWHAYPRIGFDERNQYDFYRDIPGGLTRARRHHRPLAPARGEGGH